MSDDDERTAEPDCPCGHGFVDHTDSAGCLHGDGQGQLCSCRRSGLDVLALLRQERDAARAALADLKRERDEHVRECVRLGRRVLEEESRAIRAEDERDAARAALAPLPDRYACESCGRRDGLDAVLPDAVWEQIRDGSNLLCLWCCDRRCRAAGIETSATLHFAGEAITATSRSAADDEFISRLSVVQAASEARVAALAKIEEAARLVAERVGWGWEASANPREEFCFLCCATAPITTPIRDAERKHFDGCPWDTLQAALADAAPTQDGGE